MKSAQAEKFVISDINDFLSYARGCQKQSKNGINNNALKMSLF